MEGLRVPAIMIAEKPPTINALDHRRKAGVSRAATVTRVDASSREATSNRISTRLRGPRGIQREGSNVTSIVLGSSAVSSIGLLLSSHSCNFFRVAPARICTSSEKSVHSEVLMSHRTRGRKNSGRVSAYRSSQFGLGPEVVGALIAPDGRRDPDERLAFTGRHTPAIASGHDVPPLLAAGSAQVLGVCVPLSAHQPEAQPLEFEG